MPPTIRELKFTAPNNMPTEKQKQAMEQRILKGIKKLIKASKMLDQETTALHRDIKDFREKFQGPFSLTRAQSEVKVAVVLSLGIRDLVYDIEQATQSALLDERARDRLVNLNLKPKKKKKGTK